LNKKTVIPACF